MTPLEDRLRSLANAPLPGPTGIEELRRRARRRTRRRRTLAVAIPFGVAGVIAAAIVTTTRSGDTQRVNVGPGPDEPAPTEPLPPTTTSEVDGSGNGVLGTRLFGVTGVEVQADPTRDLRDGDQIDVLVTGFEPLEGAVAVMCAGDVTPESAPTEACDLTPLRGEFKRSDGPGGVTGRATVTAARVIHLSRLTDDSGDDDSYDCAREPAGCVLAIAPLTTPVRAAVIPVSFVDVPLPTPSMTVDRTSGLQDGDQVTVTATGLRPNTAYGLSTCRSVELLGSDRDPPFSALCDVDSNGTATVATTDSRGEVSTTVAVQAGFYSYEGRIDCTTGSCAVLIRDANNSGRVFDYEPISFAANASFPEPALAIDPSGPYVDGQVVTLSGTGFPAGLDIGGNLGLCPADKDPAVEERCTYPVAFAPVEVAPDGTFSTEFRLSNSTGFGHSCVTEPGCVVSWIIPHGPAVISLPLQFTP